MAAEYSFSFTDTAVADLRETLDYISDKLQNPVAAERFLQKTEHAITTIRTFPLSGSPVNNPYIRRNDIRFTQIGNFVMYYLPDHLTKTIVILRIVYAQRDREQIEGSLD